MDQKIMNKRNNWILLYRFAKCTDSLYTQSIVYNNSLYRYTIYISVYRKIVHINEYAARVSLFHNSLIEQYFFSNADVGFIN